MQTFKLNTEGLTKKLLFRSIPSILITFVILFAIFYIKGDRDYTDASFYMPLTIIFVVIVFSLWRGLKRQKALAESYELTITDQLICREQLNTPDISILVTEVVEIAKHPKGAFTIKGSRNNGTIIIPIQIENYEQLETTLQQVHPITIKSNFIFKKLQFLLIFIAIGSMVCVYALNDKIIVGISGTLLTGLMTWSLVTVQRSKNVDRKTKNKFWFILLVLASIIGITITKLTAPAPLP